MKKKLLLTVALLALLVTGMFLFTACDSNPENCAHEWSKWTTTVEATCTNEGELQRQCSKCLTVQTDTLATTSHTGGVASCIALAKCEICGEGYGEYTTHKYDVQSTDAIYKISELSCEHAAEYYYSCVCGEKSEETFTAGEPLGHNYIYISNEDGTHTVVCTNEADSAVTVACSGGAATCIDAAECTLCGESYGEPLGHNWVKGPTALTASSSTCEASEKILYTCSHCSTTKVVILNPVGHNYKSVVTLPTCHTKGYTTHTCENCGDSFVDSEVPSNNNHAWDKELTCGNGHKCTVCGTEEAALEHDYELINSIAASCVQPAKNVYKCKNCSETYEAVVSPALGHNTTGVTPTEEQLSGCEYIQRYACTVCGTKVDGAKLMNHKYTAKVTAEANCKNAGVKTYTCSECNDTYTEAIPVDASNHVWNNGVRNNGIITYTCTVNGCYQTKSVVDASNSDSTQIDSGALGAAGGSVEFDKATLDMSQLTGNGGVLSGAGNVNISAGTLSGAELDSAKNSLTDEQKAQLGDNPIYNFLISGENGLISNFNGKEVTVTIPYELAPGEDVDSIAIWYMDGNSPKSIKATYSNGYVTFKTTHFSYYTVTNLTPKERCALYGCEIVTEVHAVTCLTDGYTANVCVRCRASYNTDIVPATGHDYDVVTTPATCTEAGKSVYTCACGDSYEEKIPATGHNYAVDKKAATCSEEGYENGLCACGAKYSVKFPKLVHELESKVYEATCENGGYTEYKCKNCDYSYKGDVTAAKGHEIKAEWTWAKNHKKADLKLTCQFGCGLEVNEKNIKASEKNVDPTCYKKGRMEYTVKYVYNGETYSDTYTEDKGSLDHVFGDDWKHNKHGHWHSCRNCSGQSERFEHEYGEGVVTKKATCKSEGEISYVCFCGEVKIEKIPRTNEHRYANGICADCKIKLECTHSYGEGVVTKAPTCTDEGAKTYTCTVCAGTKVESIASLGGHAYNSGEITKAPTCTAEGIKTFTCTVCSATDTEIVAALGHKYNSGVVTTAPTCTAEGSKLFTCTACSATRTEVVPSLGGHAYNAGEVTTAATCTADGVKTYTCTACSATKTEVIPSLGGHAYNAGEITVAPTCNADGVKTYTCTVCSAIKTEVVPMLADHVYENGVCVHCGNIYTCEHEYNAGVVTTAPTCTAEGVKTYTCGKCGGTKTEVVPSLGGHAYNAGEITTAPSCFTDGVKTYTCTVCSVTKTEVVSAIGQHSYDGGVITVAPSCTEGGMKTYTCTVCQNTITEAISAIGHHSYNGGEITTAPSCFTDGVKTYTCTVCSATKTESVPAIGHHAYDEGVVTKAPTCTKSGVKTYTCTVCSATETEKVASLGGHKYVDGFCSVCGNEYVEAYYLNLVNSWKEINGFSLVIKGLSFEMNEVDSETLEVLQFIGKIEQIDIAELYLSFKDGEISGAAYGEIEFYSTALGNSAYSLQAIIEDGYIYVSIGIGDNFTKMKISLDAVLKSFVSDGLGINETVSDGVVELIGDVLMPAIETIINSDGNSEELNLILENAFNIIFNVEKQDDGSFVVTLDYDKLETLNENLANKTIAEVVDIYFGEGSFDSVIDYCIELLNLKVSEVPEYIESLGLDYEEIVAKINEFARENGAEADFDLDALINDEKYKDLTLGMLIADVDDNSYLDEFNEEFVDVLKKETLYKLINRNNAEKIKETVSGFIDALKNITVSFTTDGDGMFTSVKFDVDSFVYNFDGYEVKISAELEVIANGEIEVDFDGIIEEIEGEIVSPEEDTDNPSSSSYFISSDFIYYKGEYYYCQDALIVRYTKVLYDNPDLISYYKDCCGFLGFRNQYERESYMILLGTIEVDGKNVFVLYDVYNNVTVELRGTGDNFVVVFEDGSEKAISIDNFDSYANVADAYVAVYHEIFENPMGRTESFSYTVEYFYNKNSGEYAEASHHSIKTEETFDGDTCSDGRTIRQYCEYCENEVIYTEYDCHYVHTSKQIEGSCGTWIYGYACEYCGKESGDVQVEFFCAFSEPTVSDILGDNGELIGRRMVWVCQNCGLIREIEEKTETEGCRVYTVRYNKYIFGSEVIAEYSENWDYTEEHDFEFKFELLGETCEDGFIVKEVCKNCNRSYNYGKYQGHMYDRSGLSLEEYGCCPGTKVNGGICEVCGKSEYTTIVPGCKNYAFGNMVEKTDANGKVYYEALFTCPDCGVSFVEKYYTTTEACVSHMTLIAELVVNGECVYSHFYDAGKTAFHKWVTSYEFSAGNDCENGYKIINTCENCGEVNTYHDYGHIYESSEIDISANTCKGGAIFVEKCFLCEKVTYIDYKVPCAKQEIYNEQLDEDGNILSTVRVCYCPDCGFKAVYEEIFEYDSACSATRRTVVKYYIGETVIQEFERIETSEVLHNYELSYMVMLGDSCEDGYFAKYVCKNCGEGYGRYLRGHNYEYVEIDLKNYGMCGGYIFEEKCSVCGYLRNSNMHVYCSWYISDESNGVITYTCHNCNATKTVSAVDGEKDKNCRYERTETETYRNANGEEIYTSQRTYYSEDHDYVVSVELMGTSCEDGYTITGVCKDCGDSYEDYSNSHYSYTKWERYELSEYGACYGYVETYECYCGYYKDYNYEICPNAVYTTDSYVDVNGDTHTVHMYNCETCSLCLEIDEFSSKDNECNVVRYRVASVSIDGEALIENFVKCDNYGSSHNYGYVFELKGDSCEDGCIVKRECSDCGYYYVEDEIYNHYTYETGSYDFSDYGACYGWLYIYECPCKEEVYVHLDSGCTIYIPTDSYVDENGIAHDVYTYVCETCGLSITEDYYTVENACYNIGHCTINVSVDGASVLENYAYVTGRTEEHDYESSFVLNGDSCEDGYKEISTCRDCGHSYENTYNSHVTYSKHYELSDYGACGGYVRHYFCPCGYSNYYDYYLHYCNYDSATSSYVDENGIEHTVHTYTCRDCGLVRSEDYHTVRDGCYEFTYLSISVSKGDVTFIDGYSQLYNTTPLHEYEYVFEMNGDDCTDGFKATQTCKNCDYSNVGNYKSHNRFRTARYELSDYGACGGYIELHECPCGYSKNFSYSSECSYSGSMHSYVDENGTSHSVYTYTCSECNLIRTEDRYQVKEGCYDVRYYVYNVKCGDVEIVKDFVRPYSRYTAHNYEYSFEKNEGFVSCEDGYKVISTCKDCGYTTSDSYSSHNTFRTARYNLYDYGACGGYIELYECPCGYSKGYNYSNACNYSNSHHSYVDENGITHNVYTYTCSDCNFVRTEDRYTVKEGCYNVTYYTLNASIDDVELVKDYFFVHNRSTAHNYEYSFEKNEGFVSCEDGYKVTSTCKDCGYVTSSSYTSHQSFNTARYNLSDYGACGGYFELYECPCGYTKGYRSSNSCSNYNGSYSNYNDENGVYHTVYTRTCHTCALVVITDTYSVKEGCYELQRGTLNVSLADEEIIKDYTYISGRYTDHNYEYSFEKNEGFVSCEDGYKEIRTCRDCGYSYNNYYYGHNTYLVNSYDSTACGACSGSINHYSCLCGKSQSVEDSGCYNNSTSNEYYDDEGRLCYANVRTCSECGKRFSRTYYTVKDSETCTLTYYYSVIVNVGDKLVANIDYTTYEKSHDYKIEAALSGDSCEDGVTITYKCNDCGHSYSDYYTSHNVYEKERIQLGNVCGGYAIFKGCACGYREDIDLSHALCDFDEKNDGVGNENAIASGWYHIYTNNYSTYIDNYSEIYTCAVTDPEQCAYKIRYSVYWLYDNDGCTATGYESYKFGYNEETGEFDREITYKSGSYRTVHKYVSEDIAETLDGGITVSGKLYTCSECGTYYYTKTHYNADNLKVKSEMKFENKLSDGNYKFVEEITCYAGVSVKNLGNYEISNVYKRINSDGTEYSYSTLYEYDFDYEADFGEDSYSKKTTSTEGNITEISEYGYTYYKGYKFTTYEHVYENVGTAAESWYKYDYVFDFDGACTRTVNYTNSKGVSTSSTGEYHITHTNRISKNPTCSQHGEREQLCVICETVIKTYEISPTAHNWVKFGSGYYCTYCDLQNANGANGTVVMEDLTGAYGNGEYYVAGYWNKGSVSFSQYVSLILKTPMENGNNEVVLTGVEFVTIDGVRAIAFSKSAVEEMALARGYDADEYFVRISFVPDGDDSSFDYGITFTDEETAPDLVVDSTEFLAYVGKGETRSFTVTPDEDGVFTFTSAGNRDTYGNLYNADGNQLAYDDDAGENNNFKIVYGMKAGETYTISVRWYSSDVSGYMPLAFTFVPAEN